jgi:hypothetical protein
MKVRAALIVVLAWAGGGGGGGGGDDDDLLWGDEMELLAARLSMQGNDWRRRLRS